MLKKILNDVISVATSFEKTLRDAAKAGMKMYRTTDKYHRSSDLPLNRSNLKRDTIVQTPGGGIFFNKKKGKVCSAVAYFNKATDYAIEHEFIDKTFSLDFENVDGKVRPVLKEDMDGYIKFRLQIGRICEICGKKLEGDHYRIHFRKADALLAMEALATPWHPTTPKFELRIVDGRQTKGNLWLALESAERTRV